MDKLQAWEELQVTPEAAEQLSGMSASSIDGRTKPYRAKGPSTQAVVPSILFASRRGTTPPLRPCGTPRTGARIKGFG